MTAMPKNKPVDNRPAKIIKLEKKMRRKEGGKKLKRSMAGNTLLFIIMGISGLFMVLPLVMIVNNALKPLDEIYQFPPRIFVRNPTLTNFSDLFVLMNESWVPFSRYIFNTIIISLGGMLGHVIVASMAGNTLLFILMGICGVFMVLPLVMIVNNALKPLDEIYQYPPRIFVRNPSLTNFSDLFVLMNESWVPFSRYILNTIIITVGGMVGHVIVASLAAYPLAKHKFPGKALLFSMVVLSMMFSWTVTQIPQYLIISWLGINNTYAALVLPAWSFGMGLYLMKQFMEQLPDSLMESARLQGATEWQIFWHIVMPNVRPAWLTLAIFQFQQMWGNTGGMFLRSEELKPLQYALQQITSGGVSRAGAGAAVTFIIAAIPITFFLICQSSILETMTTSGMKD